MDDDKELLYVLKRGLELNNFEVYAFDNPVKALEYLKSVHSPELLISDIKMPGMSGFELTREVKKSHPHMAIMILTGFEIHQSEFSQVFPSTKIDALIDKPIGLKKLVDTANTIIEKKRHENGT